MRERERRIAETLLGEEKDGGMMLPVYLVTSIEHNQFRKTYTVNVRAETRRPDGICIYHATESASADLEAAPRYSAKRLAELTAPENVVAELQQRVLRYRLEDGRGTQMSIVPSVTSPT